MSSPGVVCVPSSSTRSASTDSVCWKAFNTTHAAGNVTNVAGNFVNNVAGNVVNNPNVSMTRDEEKEIYKWLAAPDSSANFNAAQEKHHKNTGVWFLESEQFIRWKVTPSSALWINGTPGSGKTVLCSTAIKSIREGCAPGSAQAYFFFDSRSAETDQSLHHNMLRSLIKQLSRQSGCMPAALMTMYGHGDEKPSLAFLQLTLSKLIAVFEHTYIVIDALDECTDRGKLLTWIGDLLRQNTDQLHILFSSRREQEILRCFEPIASITHVSLAGASTNADIETYVDAMIATSWDAKTRARVKYVLMKGADGMFRWVSLQIDELLKCFTSCAVEEQLKLLPKDLNGMYERTLTCSANAKELKQLLIWLAFSVRQLLVEELAGVMAIDFSQKDTPTYNSGNLFFSPTHVLDLCTGFVTCVPISAGRVHRKDIYTHSREATDPGTVKLAHMSVKDYLVSERIKNGAASFFGISATLAHTKITATLAHTKITATSLAYLLHLGSLSSFSDEVTFTDFPLVRYAAENWLQHVGWGRSNEAPVWQLMICMFSRGHNALANCIELQDPHRRSRWGDSCSQTVREIKGTPPLYYASLLGMEELVKEILSRGEDVQARGGPCDNALQAASYHGHEGVVQILLEHGAHVNTHGGKYTNALRAAFHGGHVNVARLLLEHEADVTVREERRGTLLQEAARHGDFATVQLLLEHGADANAPAGQSYGTALQNASGCDNYDLVRLLLQHKADVNAPPGPEGPALQIASGRGELNIVRLLLEHGADVEAPAGPKGTALQNASGCDNYDLVQLLLEHKADVNAPAGREGTSLQVASCRGEIDIVRLLLEHGADVGAPAGPKGTALQNASRGGEYDLVRLLLEHKADVNAPAIFEDTSLQVASYRGEIDIVQLLLEHGADANAPAGYVGTALQAAIIWPHPSAFRQYHLGWTPRFGSIEPETLREESSRSCAIVRLLLERGAEVNAPSGMNGTALQIASGCGEIDIVRLLLEHHADVNAPPGPKGTALQAVISWADPDELQQQYSPPQSMLTLFRRDERKIEKLLCDEASLRGHAIVRLLLEHGADANADAIAPEERDRLLAARSVFFQRAGPNDETTVLQMATYFGECDIVRLLVEHDADVNALGGRYGTALLCASQRGDEASVRLMLERGAVMGPQEAEAFIFKQEKERNHAEILQLLLDSEAGVDREWLYRKRVEWFRGGRVTAEDYDSIEYWRDAYGWRGAYDPYAYNIWPAKELGAR
ncbi:hypothetical protein HWV62_20620 [Athelia sp. TMB]|nr:hypothetical protein HWV62_20620 [Athelia sp. TMB]